MNKNRMDVVCGRTLAVIVGLLGFSARAEAQLKRFTYSAANGESLGYVSAAGDIDRDGVNDFIIGEPGSDANGDGAWGDVYVYSGATGMKLLEFHGTNSFPGPDHGFGFATAGNGDFDGDGIPDIAIGAWGELLFGFDLGFVEIYSGKDGKLLCHKDGKISSDQFGYSVDFVVDLDGDGCDEFIVGAPAGGSGQAGHADVYQGKTGNLKFSMTGQSSTSYFGFSVRRIGDVTGDGVRDFIVGEPWFDLYIHGWLAAKRAGRAVIYSGADGSYQWGVAGLNSDTWLGYSTGSLGDVDADGYEDLAVGSPSDGGVGSVSVYSSRTAATLYTLSGDGADDEFGFSIAGVGDLSGDGTPDLVVGAPGFNVGDNTPLAHGYVRTFSGKDGTLFNTYIPSGSPAWADNGYGTSVSGTDFNADGYADWILSYPGVSLASGGSGLVEVWSGCPATWNNFGSGWAGTNGIPAFTLSGKPAPAQTITLAIGNSSGIGASGLLFIGLDDASIQTNVGGTLLVNVLLTQPIFIPNAGLSITDAIPNDPSLLGVEFFMQAIETDPGASKGVSFTRGVRTHIGFAYP